MSIYEEWMYFVTFKTLLAFYNVIGYGKLTDITYFRPLRPLTPSRPWIPHRPQLPLEPNAHTPLNLHTSYTPWQKFVYNFCSLFHGHDHLVLSNSILIDNDVYVINKGDVNVINNRHVHEKHHELCVHDEFNRSVHLIYAPTYNFHQVFRKTAWNWEHFGL